MASAFDIYDDGEDSAPWLGKWKTFIAVIDAALARKRPDAFRQASFDEAEREHFQKLREQIKRNRSTFWTNSHREYALFNAYGCNLTFFLSSAVPDKVWRDPAKQKELRIGLRRELADRQARFCKRAGFVVRVHPAIFDPDAGKVPLHFHAWLLPYHLPEKRVRMLQENPEEALRRIARKGESMPGKGGPISRWLASRHIGEEDWSKLIAFCRGFWQEMQERIFGVKVPSSEIFGLVNVREDGDRPPIRRRVRMIPNDLDPLQRNALGLARMTTYIAHGPSLADRMTLDFGDGTGKVAVTFKHNGGGTYSPLEFCRRFLPPKPSTRGTTCGMLNRRDEDHPAMRVFAAAFGEMVETDNRLLHWATLSPTVIRRRLAPEDTWILREEAEEARIVMERRRAAAEWKNPHPSPATARRRALWDAQHRFFSGEYVIVLYFLQYLAEQATKKKPRGGTAKEPPPVYALHRYPLQAIKMRAEGDMGFIQWYARFKPKHAAQLLRDAVLRAEGEPVGRGRPGRRRWRNPSNDV